MIKLLVLNLLPKTCLAYLTRQTKLVLLRQKVEDLILLRDESRRRHDKYSHIQNQIVRTNTEILKLEGM